MRSRIPRAIVRLRARLGAGSDLLARTFQARTPLELTLLLTVIALTLYGGNKWYLVAPVRVLGVLAIVNRTVLLHPATWSALLAITAFGNAAQWYRIDNHKFLMTYWTAACALAAASTQPAEVLRHNARWLVMIGFGLACLWKLATPEFRSGDFLEFTLLTDERVEGVAATLCKLPRADLADNRALLALASIAPQADLRAQLNAGTFSALAGKMMTTWTFAIEGAVAVAFLWRESRTAVHVRNALLLAFIVTTYPLLPVAGFAGILAILGLASSAPNAAWIGAFSLCFIAAAATIVPWQSILS